MKCLQWSMWKQVLTDNPLLSHSVLLLGVIIQYADVLEEKQEQQPDSEYMDTKLLGLEICDCQ